MKLMFMDKIASWTDSFDVLDEIGRKLYRVCSKPDGTRPRLKVYASYLHNKSAATLSESLNEAPAVEIKHGTRFVSVVRNMRPGIFDLGFMGWYAAGELEKGNFVIYDGYDPRGRVVATVDMVRPGAVTMRMIDTLPEYTLHALTFTLAVHVQLSSMYLSNGVRLLVPNEA